MSKLGRANFMVCLRKCSLVVIYYKLMFFYSDDPGILLAFPKI